MRETVLCKICEKRRARRACPAVHGDICTLCCGAEREVSLSCPLECEYLREAHLREEPVDLLQQKIPNADIEVTEEFLESRDELLAFCVYALLGAALRTEGAVDTDVIDALEALIQTRRTLNSGLIYETRAHNHIALAVQSSFEDSLKDYQKMKEERDVLSPVRNSDVLTILVFLHRVGQVNQNGRPRGRMYVDLLRKMSPAAEAKDSAPSIIL